MWLQRTNDFGVIAKFFRIGVAHNTLKNYYQTNFALMQHHKYSLYDIENMIPWERDIYTLLLENWLKAERERIKREVEEQQKKMESIQNRNRAKARKVNGRY